MSVKSEHESTLQTPKMPRGPQHQIFNQDFIIFVKVSKHILLLVGKISFIFNKWWNEMFVKQLLEKLTYGLLSHVFV